jgi:fibro-slime domain-containing protein
MRLITLLEKSIKNLAMRSWIVVLLLISVTWSANYPDTMRVWVTFYDFHSNLSNPEFETIPSASATEICKNMVSDTLDTQGKPTVGANPYFNLSVAKWFRPWAAGDFTFPNYGNYSIANAAGITPKFLTVGYDTAFKNIVSQDTLVFTYVSGSEGVYQFDNQTFFPLDGKGFGAEGKPHNFSFTMELHRKFIMEPGLNFQFTGDDDVWAFINNKLVMDLGGRHNPLPGAVNVDTLGLVSGREYSLDFFYCERHTNSATAKIVTNIFKARSDSILIVKSPARDSIAAGDSVTFFAKVTNLNGALCSLCTQNVTWAITPSTDQTRIHPTAGGQITFYAVSAYRFYAIEARYDDPINSTHLLRIDTVYVKPGAADHLVLEADDDSLASLRSDAPITPDSLIFSAGMLNDSIYAVLRDRFGNWVGHAALASWISSDTTAVIVSAGRAQLGEGVLTRQTARRDTIIIIAMQDNLKDSLSVIISDIAYSRIQMFVISNGIRTIDTLMMQGDVDTTLHARGLRADGSGIWDGLAVSWGSSSGLVFNSKAPEAADKWTMRPEKTASGIIAISYMSQSQLLGDTLYALFSLPITRNFTAWANDNKNKRSDIDNDDFVLLTFDQAVAIFPVTAGNIDSVFPLSNGHSWLSGSQSIGGTEWNADSTRILITLSTQTAAPTISVGDTIACSFARNKTVLTGSFGSAMSANGGKQKNAAAQLISISQSHCSEDGLVFTFSSSIGEGIKIRIIDIFGRIIADFHAKEQHRIGTNRFIWNDNQSHFNKPITAGIYLAQVFGNGKLVKSVSFFSK